VAGVPPPHSIRHQWYQLGDRVVVDVYAKGLTGERFQAAFSDDHLRLTVLRGPAAASSSGGGGGGGGGGGAPETETAAVAAAAEGEGEEGPEWELDVDLFGRVQPSACRFEILRTKVEVTLRKAEAGKAWPSLEKSSAPALAMAAPATQSASSSGGIGAAAAAPAASAPSAATAQPAAPTPAGPPRTYPSSHIKNPKDWSALEREVKEMESKGELDDGDPLNNFFKKIFSQGDEDTRRAMMKSFVESNGTVLSTNWDEVGQKTVETTPPEGMEVKKWGAG